MLRAAFLKQAIHKSIKSASAKMARSMIEQACIVSDPWRRGGLRYRPQIRTRGVTITKPTASSVKCQYCGVRDKPVNGVCAHCGGASAYG